MSTDGRSYIGWDIGGAHLKVAQLLSDGSIGIVMQIACPLWQGMDKLESAYRSVGSTEADANCMHVVTMSGELADSFDDREQGVRSILSAMRRLLGQPFQVYAGDEGLLDDHAIADTKSVASKNWQATAEWLAVRCKEGILVDMGSTTTDIIPFKAGQVAAHAYDDATRMQCGELIYTGIGRTPIMAIADRFNIGDVDSPITAEYFATIADVYRILGKLPEDSDLYPTCDNTDKSFASSARRLERMFGLDWAGNREAVRVKAQAVADVQQRKISRALSSVLKRSGLSKRAGVIGAGSGYGIVQCIAEQLGLKFMPYHRLSEKLPQHLNDKVCCCATAVSAASLAQQKHS